MPSSTPKIGLQYDYTLGSNGWKPGYDENWQRVDATILTTYAQDRQNTAALDYAWLGGYTTINGAITLVPPDSITLPNNTTRYIERDLLTGTVYAVAGSFSFGIRSPMAIVVTAGGAISNVTDSRLANDSVYDLFTGGIDAKRFKCVGSGVVDDSIPLQNALTAADGKKLLLTPGSTYAITSQLEGPSNITIIGFGAKIKPLNGTRYISAINWFQKDNIKIFGLEVLEGFSSWATYTVADDPTQYQAFNFEQTTNVTIKYCKFNDLYVQGLNFHLSNGGLNTVEENYFSSPVQGQIYNLQHIRLGSSSAKFSVKRNKFENTKPANPSHGVGAILAGGTSNVDFSCNELWFCGRDTTGTHQIEPICFYGDHKNLTVQANVAYGCLYGFLRLTNCSDVNVTLNFAYLADVASTQQFVSIESTTTDLGIVGVQNGCQRVRVHTNTFVDDYLLGASGVVVESLDYVVPLEDIEVVNNTFKNISACILVLGPYRGMTLESNKIRGVAGFILVRNDLNGTPIGAAFTGAPYFATEAASYYRALKIKYNEFDYTTAGSVPIFINMSANATYAGRIEKMEVGENYIKFSGGISVATAIAYRGPSNINKQGTLLLNRNTIDGFAIGIDAANAAICRVFRPEILNCTADIDTGNFITNTLYSYEREFGIVTPTEAVLVSGVLAAINENIKVTLTANRLVGAPLVPNIGQKLVFTFVQDGVGGRNITWNAVFKHGWSDVGNTANKRSSITFEYDGTNWNQVAAQSPYI